MRGLTMSGSGYSMEEPKGEGGGQEGPPRPTMTRRISYSRNGMDESMDADEFTRNVSIDASKLNEYLYKMHMRMESVEKNLGDYIKSMTAKAKEEKDALAREIEAMDHDDETARYNASQQLEAGSGQGSAKGDATSGSGFGTFGQLEAFEGYDGGGAGDTQGMNMSHRSASGTLREKHEVVNDKVEALRHMMSEMGGAIHKVETDLRQRTKLQAAKDTAQDEILEMELKRLERQIDGKLSKSEIIESNKMQDYKMKNLEAVMMGALNSKTQELNVKLAEELDRVLDQLNNIQESSDAQSRIMEDRIQQAVKQGLSRRENPKEKRLLEELSQEMRRLMDQNARLELRAAELESELETSKQRITTLEEVPEPVEVEQIVEQVMGQVEVRLVTTEDRVSDVIENGSVELKADIEALESRLLQELEGKQTSFEQMMEETRISLEKLVEELRADFDAYKRESRKEVELAFVQLQRLVEERANQKAPDDITPLLAEAMEELRNQFAEQNRNLLDRLTVLNNQLLDADDKADMTQKHNVNMLAVLRDDVMARMEERKREYEGILNAKTMEIEQALQGSSKQLTSMIKNSITDVLHRCEESDKVNAEKRGLLNKEIHEVKHGSKQMALKALRPDMAQSLGEDPNFADLTSTLAAQRADNDYHIARLERSAIGLAELYRQMHGIVRGLATKDNHWAALDARLHEHLEALVTKCLEAQGGASSAKAFSLSKELRDYIASNAYRIAKIIATKADYEVIRRIVSTRDVTNEEDWDATVADHRERILTRFMSEIVNGSHRAYPAHEVPLLEARARFCEKTEKAIRLALSKFAKISVAYTLFGKMRLDNVPACVACDRPFGEHSGPGDRRAVCQDHLPCGTRDKPSSAQSRTRDPAIHDTDMRSIGERSQASSRRSKPAAPSSSSTAAPHISSSSSLGSRTQTSHAASTTTSSSVYSNKKTAVYRAGFKFPRASSGSALPLLYMDPAAINEWPGTPLTNNPPLPANATASNHFPSSLIKVDEEYEVVGGRNKNGSNRQLNPGSPSSVASSGSSIVSHLPSVEG